MSANALSPFGRTGELCEKSETYSAAGPYTIPQEVDMHDTKERLSLLWIFAFLNYLYADVLALWDIVGSLNVAGAITTSPTMGSGGFSGLDGNTHGHDCGVSATSV